MESDFKKALEARRKEFENLKTYLFLQKLYSFVFGSIVGGTVVMILFFW